MPTTLYIYAAHPRHPELEAFHYVGFATVPRSLGPSDAFSRVLTRLQAERVCTAQRIARLLPREADWEVRILELDEGFTGTRQQMEERRRFYMYWLRHHEQRPLLNRREPLALNPTWRRTWSVLDSDHMLL